jgi:ribosomal protein S18 acetylase RimI-like enzyme
MSSDLSNLIRLKKADVRAAGEVLARAFQDYPLMEYFMPDDSKRRRRLPMIFRTLVRQGLKYGEVYATSAKFEGVAVWFPHGSQHDSRWRMLFSGQFVIPFIVGRETIKRKMAFGRYAGAVRKRVAPSPHWYLQGLGVDPAYQGRGFASRLLKPMFERMDKEGLPCYLETQAGKNVALYEHLGFKVAEEGLVPDTDIKSWAMLRGKGGEVTKN